MAVPNRPAVPNRSGLPDRADRIVVMGVLNVTPDSFSDGGRWADLERALAHGLAMHAGGADLVDVGGESTRPGAQRVDAAEETRRVVPVVTELASAGVRVSVDTYRAGVAEAALHAGASVVNDVSGGLGDPDMAALVRSVGCPWVLMHWRGHSAHMQALASYTDVVADVRAELSQRVDAAISAGVAADQLVLDPGLGFAKTAAHNWDLLANLDAITSLGFPVLVAASRKSFLGRLLAAPDPAAPDVHLDRPTDQREDATTAITAYCALHGVWGIRTHEVRASVDAAVTIAAIQSRR